jgi:hypothetical protein
MKRLITLIVAALALAFAGAAVANVLVYKNNFSKQKHVKQIKKLQGGGKCKSAWKGKKAYRVRVNTGNRDCLFRTPVEGDRARPDYTIQAAAKALRKTHKRVRNKVYIGLAARADRKSSYEVRVFPKTRKFRLLKNGEDVAEGEHEAIKPMNRNNLLRLSVQRNVVIAKVNGKRLAKFNDRASEQVAGRKTALAFGSEAKANKVGLGVFDSVRVLVPSP